jgi:hypothetical protein
VTSSTRYTAAHMFPRYMIVDVVSVKMLVFLSEGLLWLARWLPASVGIGS